MRSITTLYNQLRIRDWRRLEFYSYLKGDITDFDIIEGPLSEKLDFSGTASSDEFLLFFFSLLGGSFDFFWCFNGFFYVGHGGNSI